MPHGPTTPTTVQRAAPAWGWWTVALVTAVLLGAAALLAYHRFAYTGRIMPGVRIGTIEVGSLAPEDALDLLAAEDLDPRAEVSLSVDGQVWAVPAVDSGVTLDARATVAEAYAVGRRGSLPAAVRDMLRARFFGRTLSPIVTVDDRRLRDTVEAVADAFDRPARNASLAIVDGTDIQATTAEIGQALDVPASLVRIEAEAARGAWPIDGLDLPFNTIAPEIPDASLAVAQAQALLAGPLTLRDADRTWSLGPNELGPMLYVTTSHGAVTLGMDEARLGVWLEPVTDAISRTSRLPRFHFDVDTVSLSLIKAGEPARHVDGPGTAARILAAAEAATRTVPVATIETGPAVSDTVRAEDLGIRDLVVSQTSRFVGSPPERIHNIGLAAAAFDGVLVPPGAVFSFNDNLGDITEEGGYQKTKIIMDGATQDGIGGGVCQVSTTVFRAAFYAGLPIVQRYAHGYRVPYYEQGAPAGIDATVYSPQVDLKFLNDTGAWLLVETDADAGRATVTFRFYGTSPGRQVTLEGPEIGRQVPPPAPRTEIDPALAPGETHTVELARNGATVTVVRVIKQGDAETRETFVSHYRPTGLVTAVGPPDPSAPAAATPDSEAVAPETLTPGSSGVP